jgi:hypothetical protein
LEDSSLQQLLAAFGMTTPQGGDGNGLAQDATLQALLAFISGTIPGNLVRVNSGGTGGAQASPYTAKPGDYVVVDTSTGSVVINLPVLASKQVVQVLHDQSTSLAANTVTINGPGAVKLAQPAPNNAAAFISPFVYGGATAIFTGDTARGMDLTYVNGGSSAGYLLQ